MSLGSGMDVFRGKRIPNFDIVGRRRLWFVASSVLVAVSIVALFVPGLSYSIDFRGGASLAMENPAEASVEEVRTALRGFDRAGAEVQIVAGGTMEIRTESLADLGQERTELLQRLAEVTGVQPDDISVEDVGPSWGGQISAKMLQALIIFLVLVTLYISFRFEFKMAIGALVALFHDVIITAGVYALFRLEVTPETIIAILTILGFSLYDTIVIYDKIRDNVAHPALLGREGYGGVVNYSLNQTIMRSLNTSLVVLLPIISLMLFGGDTLKAFAFALFIGTVVGVYSSIFVAAPLLTVLKEREPRYRQRGGGASGSGSAKAAKADSADEGEDAEAPKKTPARQVTQGGSVVQARPRKKKSPSKRRRR